MQPSSESTRGCWPHMRLRRSDSSLIKFESFRSVKTGGHVAIQSFCAQGVLCVSGDLRASMVKDPAEGTQPQRHRGFIETWRVAPYRKNSLLLPLDLI